MKLPSNYFDNLSNSKYRQYLKLLPDLHQENTRLITMLILTFIALSIFGIFAINPTLTTIIDLQKQLDDSELTHQQLTTKISNLSELQQKFNTLTSDLPYVESAIPKQADATTLTGQIHALAQQSNLTILSFRIAQVQIAGINKTGPKGLSYIFNLEATGSYDDMMQFAINVANFNRIVTIEAISIGRDPRTHDLVLNLRGRQYFIP